MKRIDFGRRCAVVFLLGVLGIAASLPARAASLADAFAKEMKGKAAAAEKSGSSVIPGKEGWLFFAPELRSLGAGKFWGASAARASSVADKSVADPLPAILDFKAQLDRKGIALLMVPVPAKATIYPEKISGLPALKSAKTPPRLDAAEREFYRVLARSGVKVLDLTPLFLQNRSAPGGPLYCRQDSHWSGAACQLTARRIAAEAKKASWYRSVPKRKFVTEKGRATVAGDLWNLLGSGSAPKETLSLTYVKERSGGYVTPWRASPVLLLGDSHNLVFHDGGDMLARGAGLPDHLADQLGFPVDLVAVRGSGATPARIDLLRRRDDLAGKKLVVWCFSVREFTEGQGWRKVPVIRK
jgi:alginate O-acetyltransferase complex protein AlgJ